MALQIKNMNLVSLGNIYFGKILAASTIFLIDGITHNQDLPKFIGRVN
jgi:hypothetical protein